MSDIWFCCKKTDKVVELSDCLECKEPKNCLSLASYKQGRNDAIEEVIAMFKADFDKQNRVNSLYIPTVVVNENIYIDLEQLKENYEK